MLIVNRIVQFKFGRMHHREFTNSNTSFQSMEEQKKVIGILPVKLFIR